MIRMPAALKDAGSPRGCCCRCTTNWCEAPIAEADEVCRVARAVMERAAEPAVQFSVPLLVEARAAGNWDEAH